MIKRVMMRREEWPRVWHHPTTAAPHPISMLFVFMETRDTGGQGTVPLLPFLGRTKRERRPRMTLAGSVQVLVLFIFVCVPRGLPTPVTATSVSVRLNSFIRLAGRSVLMSLRKFHLKCLQSVVYRCRAEATVHHLIPKAIFHTYGPALQGRSRR